MPDSHIARPAPKGEKLAQRLSHIISRLHQGDVLEKRQLAQDLQVNVRTIERDLGERLYGIAEQNADGCWQLVSTSRSSIPSKHLHGYARMSGTEHLFPDNSLDYLLGQLQTPEQQRTTHVQAIAHEDLRARTEVFFQLQTAIKQKNPCHFEYKDKARTVQPYKLIHKNGVWYLAAEESFKLKNFSIALIKGLQVDAASHFTPKRNHQDYIAAKDDVWFTEDTTEVLLRVAPDVAHYFLRRPLLPYQQQRQDTDSSLLVTTKINHIDQLLPVVRYWLPHVRIIQPQAWHEELKDGLRQALAQWDTK
ncbi:WYL domain-containing protein [Comamonas aquatica]|uniref:helix-turn-helix transcriptional regulator n=1 Tax=Comamonas aquatica TaxID=225991 RepID=UPI00244B3D72|nr:WYL domain-containing protein [Comamonas aquatica]MDH0901355.1 WYL domain-containing protein [Comamonas aquatica]